MQKTGYFLKRFIYSGEYKWRMGLEDEASEDDLFIKRIKETILFEMSTGNVSSSKADYVKRARGDFFFIGDYPNEGRIDLWEGFNLACNYERTPKVDFGLLIKSKSVVNAENPALERFKGLVRVLQKVYKIRNSPSQVKGYQDLMTRSSKTPSEDRDLYLPAIALFSRSGAPKYPNFDKFLSALKPHDFLDLFTGGNTAEHMKKFNHGEDAEFLSQAQTFLSAVMKYARMFGSHKNDPTYNVFARRVTSLSRELNRAVNRAEYPALLFGAEEVMNIPVPDLATLLLARLNYSSARVMTNDSDCCITGPYGRHRAASILYWLDPSVFTWEIYACSQKKERHTSGRTPFGLGIFVKAKGHHFSKSENEDYLVFEGFPANIDHYGSIDELVALNEYSIFKEYEDDGAFEFPSACANIPYRTFSLPELIYVIGLLTAKKEKIPKLFINTNHSDHTQQSVQDSIRGIVNLTGYQDSWDYEGNTLVKDPLTNESLASIKVGKKKLQYTHFLQKPPLDGDLVRKLKKSKDWNGEGFFDTWYWWNRFIGNTYQNWSESLRNAHPYAELVYERAKTRRGQDIHPESYWNHGIGYCKGFEVDVEKECKRLGIS